jgi:hypothetical protein
MLFGALHPETKFGALPSGFDGFAADLLTIHSRLDQRIVKCFLLLLQT